MRALPRQPTVQAAGFGALAALGHAPVGWPVLTLAGLAGVAVLLGRAADARAAGWTGWAAGAGYFAVTLHWIVEPFLVDIARHGWMAPFALALMAGGLALFWALAGWAAAWLTSPGGTPRGLVWAAALTGAEMLRAVVFTGFPWGLVGSVWVDTPVRMLGAWIGPHGLGLLTLLIAVALAQVLRGPARLASAAVAAGAVVASIGAGALALRAVPETASADRPVIRLVQPNAAQRLKWREDMIPVFWERALTLTADGPPVDAVIWPEVSLFYLWGTNADADARIADAAQGAAALVGAQRFDRGDLYNALGVIAADGTALALYDKHHLVPFGEYFPGGQVARWLGLTGLATDYLGGFTPGPGPRVLDLRAAGLGRALPLICYEAIFPRHARTPRGSPRPDWIVQVTNDAWFGRFAGPQQHLAQARMRAVEQGLPLVRAANTGISAVIDPAGRITGALPLDTAGALDRPLPAPVAPPPFARVGSAPVLALLAGILGCAAWRRTAGRARRTP
ncbi:apolipoprotein N-acyltransferase [Meridianimarinicoccus sp. RP-17]|uniref:apolipoprotein N-acyltransferase n=1 Tax=Meridianimarinicoccus zhengii TaxID=2056810 RepID=UPI000DAD3860|nr:apolipoprotein N-acyltransferase [Phycocomes zhengii]